MTARAPGKTEAVASRSCAWRPLRGRGRRSPAARRTSKSRSKRRSSRSWTSRRSSACWSPASSPAAPTTSTPIRKRSGCCAASSGRSRRSRSSTPTSCRSSRSRRIRTSRADGRATPPARATPAAARNGAAAPRDADSRCRCPRHIKEEKDLEPYERLFANTAYWKTIGEEYQNPLIVTGTVLFTPNTRRRLRAARPGSVRQLRPPPRRARRAPTWSARASSCGRSSSSSTAGPGATMYSETLPRRDSLQRAAEHAGAVVLLRADGSPGPELPERAQQPEDQGHARPAELGAARAPWRIGRCRTRRATASSYPPANRRG